MNRLKFYYMSDATGNNQGHVQIARPMPLRRANFALLNRKTC